MSRPPSRFKTSPIPAPRADAGADAPASAEPPHAGKPPSAWRSFRDLLDAIPEAVVMVDASGVFRYANANAEALFGHPFDRLRPRALGMVAVGGRPLSWEAFWTLLGQERHISGVRVEIADADLLVTPLDTIWRRRDRDGLDLAIGFCRIAESLRPLSGPQLDFLAGLSQELRAPLQGVIGMSDLLLASPLTQEQQEMAASIRGNAALLSAAVDEIGDFVNLRTGRMELTGMPFSPARLLEEVGCGLAPMAEERGVRLIVAPRPGSSRQFRGDGQRIRQLLHHLAAYALGALRGGRLVLRHGIAARAPTAEPSAPCLVEFHLEDDGPKSARVPLAHFGFPGVGLAASAESEADGAPAPRRPPGAEEGQEAVARSLPADAIKVGDGLSTLVDNARGLGLGPPIAAALARLMGGTIQESNNAGHGSRFRVTLPLSPAAEEEPSAPAASPPLAGRRALLIDTDRIEREIYRSLLETLGMEVEEAAGGHEALIRLRACELLPDVVLADYELGRIDGPLLIRGIKEDPDLCSAPVVGMAAAGHVNEYRQLPEGWVTLVLVKPLLSEAAGRGLAAVARASRKPPRKTRRTGGDQNPSVTSFPGWPARPLAGRRILLADDHGAARRVVAELLTGLGCLVDVVDDALIARDRLKRGNPDLLLADMELSNLDSLAAALEICRRSSGRRPVRMIGLTDNSLDSRRRYPHVRLDASLPKPVEPIALIETLERMLG